MTRVARRAAHHLNGICNTTSSFPVRDKDRDPKWNGCGKDTTALLRFFFMVAEPGSATMVMCSTTRDARQGTPSLDVLATHMATSPRP